MKALSENAIRFARFHKLWTARPGRSTGKRSPTRADLQGRRGGCFSALINWDRGI
jgi:hypothetical protein